LALFIMVAVTAGLSGCGTSTPTIDDLNPRMPADYAGRWRVDLPRSSAAMPAEWSEERSTRVEALLRGAELAVGDDGWLTWSGLSREAGDQPDGEELVGWHVLTSAGPRAVLARSEEALGSHSLWFRWGFSKDRLWVALERAPPSDPVGELLSGCLIAFERVRGKR
jgi:hypothetical protein